MSLSAVSGPESGEAGEVWLALDTSTPIGSVAVWRDGLVAEQSLRIQGAHSERVLPAIHQVLETTGTSAGEVSSFVVGSGPGSFTGVRVAAALAKGWVMARRPALFAYPSLLAVAAGVGPTGCVCSMFDARRRQLYAACYELTADGLHELMAPGSWRLEELLTALVERGLRPSFAGEAARLHRAAIAERLPDSPVLGEHLACPRAGSLLWLRRQYPELGRVQNPAAWEPLYVRDWKVQEEHGSA